MQKDFDQWFKIKSKLEERNCSILFKEGEVWWCSIGVNTKQESCGKGGLFKRPVLVIKRLSKELCIIIPLTSKHKRGTWFFNLKSTKLNSTFLLYQIRLISTARLTKRFVTLPSNQFNEIKKRLKQFIF
jgi:mRNA-degrading endonuclease toxin of MazEF toxin-antitoxin module